MKHFKSGDRISVYGNAFGAECRGAWATVIEQRSDGWLWADPDAPGRAGLVHYRQCVKLKKKSRLVTHLIVCARGHIRRGTKRDPACGCPDTREAKFVEVKD